jgi:hypothetical protein
MYHHSINHNSRTCQISFVLIYLPLAVVFACRSRKIRLWLHLKLNASKLLHPTRIISHHPNLATSLMFCSVLFTSRSMRVLPSSKACTDSSLPSSWHPTSSLTLLASTRGGAVIFGSEGNRLWWFLPLFRGVVRFLGGIVTVRYRGGVAYRLTLELST